MDLMAIRARAVLVEARTSLVNAARGFSKTTGERLAACDADQMGMEKASELPKGLQEVLRPLLEQVEALTAAIKECDRKLEQIAKDKYPETTLRSESVGAAEGITGSIAAAAGAGGSVNGGHQRVRPETGADRKGQIS